MENTFFHRRLRGATLIELILCMTVLLILLSCLWAVPRADSELELAHRDMDALAEWLEAAVVRADRWRMDFYLSAILSTDPAQRHKLTLQWISRRKSIPVVKETFNSAETVRWKFQSSARNFNYSWSAHTVSPAFVLSVQSSDARCREEKITVSVRGLITRSCSCRQQ
ncbi:MAG: hypothetical protein SOZ52_03930 [Pyramidobacter sp.]|nr:hypothetical protein [Pyramidobacter sp.]